MPAKVEYQMERGGSLATLAADVRGLIGNTPHIQVPTPDNPNLRVYVKLEGLNPTGSIKDRTAIGLIEDATVRGALTPDSVLLDASSGNMACAVAYLARVMGRRALLIVSSKVTPEKRQFLEYYGAEVRQIGDYTIHGTEYCRTLVGTPTSDQYCFLDQLHNWANPQVHYEQTGLEIVTRLPQLAMVVGSLGSGGTMLGVARMVKDRIPNALAVAVHAAPGTRLPGVGSFDDGDYVTPFINAGVRQKLFDLTVKVNEPQAIASARRLRDCGVFGGVQAGAVFHAALEAASRLDVRGDVLVIAGDAGWKNMTRLLDASASKRCCA